MELELISDSWKTCTRTGEIIQCGADLGIYPSLGIQIQVQIKLFCQWLQAQLWMCQAIRPERSAVPPQHEPAALHGWLMAGPGTDTALGPCPRTAAAAEKCVIPPWESHGADAGVFPVLGLAGFHSVRSTTDPLPSGVLHVIILSSAF